jgi:hypothetical protein
MVNLGLIYVGVVVVLFFTATIISLTVSLSRNRLDTQSCGTFFTYMTLLFLCPLLFIKANTAILLSKEMGHYWANRNTIARECTAFISLALIVTIFFTLFEARDYASTFVVALTILCYLLLTAFQKISRYIQGIDTDSFACLVGIMDAIPATIIVLTGLLGIAGNCRGVTLKRKT